MRIVPSKKLKASPEPDDIPRPKKSLRRREPSAEPESEAEGSQEPELSAAESHSDGDVEMSESQVSEPEQILKKPQQEKPKILSEAPRGVAVRIIPGGKFLLPVSTARKIGSQGRATATSSRRRNPFIK